MLDGDAAALVGEVAVALDEPADDGHGRLGALFQRLTLHQMTDEHGREDIAGTVEEHGNLFVVETEIRSFVEMLGEAHQRLVATTTDDTVATIDTGTGDYHRSGTQRNDGVEHATSLVPRESLFAIGGIGEQTGLGVVREGEVGHTDHLAHQLYLTMGHTVVETTGIAHDRIDEDSGALFVQLLAIVGDERGLLLTEHQSGANGIETETKLAPHGDGATHIVGRFQHVEPTVVERVGNERRRQIIGRMAKIGQDGQHSHHAYMAVAYHIIDEQNLFHSSYPVVMSF